MKHILNNLSDEEKKSILEQHTGGIKVITENFSKLLNSTLGDVKPLVNEQAEDQNTHRYDKGEQSPGIEKFLTNPMDTKVENGLMNQLRNDPYGKGKIIIFFNGERKAEPGSFIQKIQSDYRGGKCYEITNYEYNNRLFLNTQIKITANGVECKKTTEPIKTSGGTTPIKTGGGTTPPKPKVKKKCKYKVSVPFEGESTWSEKGVRQFQEFCSRNKEMWAREFSDGTKSYCSSKDVDGKWGCCSQTCYESFKKRKISN